MVELETERLRLRQWRPGDVDALERIYAEPDVWRMLAGPFTREAVERQVERFRRHWDERGFGIWAVDEKASGRMIGRVGLQRHDEWTASEGNVEVGWTLGREFWGRGLATEGALASIRFGFETVGLAQIISFTLTGNLASRRVMEKCGLTYRGETVWRGLDHVWYAIDR